MSKLLVTYFSAGGVTARAARNLAQAVGVTRQTIGLIESGNYNPTLKLCVAICQALGKTLNDLFWEEETT